MSEVRHQLLITLVHGTWPRGFFPRLLRFKQRVRELMRRRQPWDPPPFWFEEGSHFLARLSAELRDIPNKITPLLWSGANSIFVRDKTAHVLAEHLSAEHAEHPQATQLVIAHSHGGNIALRALHHLHQHDASRLGGAESANPLVVTLATPFVEVQHADIGLSPTFIRVAVFFVIWIPLWGLAKAIFPREFWNVLPSLIGTAVALILLGFIYWYWFSQRATARRQNQVEALRDATRLGDRVSVQAQRLLIIRAIDDEASLVLALGTIGNYITTRAIKYVLWIILAPISLILIPVFEEQWYEYEGAVQVGCSALILILLSLLSVARTAHGRELAVSPMELQINTQSAPDAKGLSEIVTLVRRTYVKSLRHRIYDHEDCAKTISDWVRSRLCARPAC
jgi:preprotein translocase subunit YajC